MKVIISNWDGTCAECSKEIKEVCEIYFCSPDCVELYKKWIQDNDIDETSQPMPL